MAEHKFFGRQNYLELLKKRINGFKDKYRQNIAIIGDESVGKTSLIFGLLNKFQDSRIIILYLEVRTEPLHSFVKRFIGVLLYNFLTNSGLALKEELGFLIAESEKYIPKTISKINIILGALNRKKKSSIFTELFSLCESINEETTKSCVVILDEFHHLEKLGIKDLYKEWSRLLIAQKNTMYIIVSSLKQKAKTILSKNLSLLFGNFEIISLEPFDINTSERYLDSRLEEAAITPALKNFIVHFTGGNPFYLKLISESILNQPQSGLSPILEDLLFESSGFLNTRFLDYIKRILDLKNNNDCLAILYQISAGKNRIKDVAGAVHKTKKDIMLKIGSLLELDVISRTGDFLKINDRVFSFWLRFVYQEKQRSLTFDAKNQKDKFRQNIENMLQDFYSYLDKPVLERMTEVLHLFEDDFVNIERHKIKLNHFREVKPLEFKSGSLRDGLIGRSGENLWIMAFKADLLTECDISEFAKECKKFKNKLQRKIIITLKGIDANTRLKALEEKILTWDINNLNQILELYSKPWVIA